MTVIERDGAPLSEWRLFSLAGCYSDALWPCLSASLTLHPDHLQLHQTISRYQLYTSKSDNRQQETENSIDC
jgi:UDP-N-acetylmuramoylalanine-D-glutamate ligase